MACSISFDWIFTARQIGPETIYLKPVVITSGDPVEAIKNCGESCSVSGQLLGIDNPNFSDQLGGFDNFSLSQLYPNLI